MTRSRHEFELVRFYTDWGLNNCEIERLTGIPRNTVRAWRQRILAGLTNSSHQRGAGGNHCPTCGQGRLNGSAYAYALGIYLGDGHIARCAMEVYRLTIVQDQKYIGLISECNVAISSLIEGHVIHVGFQQRQVASTSTLTGSIGPAYSPNTGPGRKHERDIRLVEWQRRIVDRYPGGFIRCLIHSDGYRGLNLVRRPVTDGIKEYAYPRYQFTNESADIKTLFCESCDHLGIRWRRMNRKTISIARKDDVEKMDAIVGPKY